MQSDTLKDFVLDQLAELGVTARAMFGGHGLYRGAEFFAILHRGRLYFRTDDQSRAAYLAHGMQPFRPNDRQTLAAYYEVPAEVLEDDTELLAWARAALAIHPKPPRK
jgi:DNA transformation protein and related proteins